jgi:hypothetical protein
MSGVDLARMGSRSGSSRISVMQAIADLCAKLCLGEVCEREKTLPDQPEVDLLPLRLQFGDVLSISPLCVVTGREETAALGGLHSSTQRHTPSSIQFFNKQRVGKVSLYVRNAVDNHLLAGRYIHVESW